MNRREFIRLLGGALTTEAMPANAQELRVRTVGVLMGLANDAEAKARVKAFEQGLEREGWSVGQNLRIEYRYAEGDSVRMQALAKELVELKPDCILGHSTPVVTALMQAARTIPIVFVSVTDPVGSGFVASLARPGGNATGFLMFEYGLSGKWLERLKQTAPALKRVAVLRDPTIASGIGQFGAIQSAAPSLGLEAIPVNVHDEGDIERDLAFAEWRRGRDAEPRGVAASPSDYYARGPARIAGDLLLPLLRRRGWPDLLRA